METCDKSKKNPKRKFSEAWLSDDRYKHWIRQVLSDEFSFNCDICKRNFSCSSQVSRHADSACHINKMKEIESCNNVNLHTSNRYSKKTFRQQWLDNEDFKFWLREVPNNPHSFQCNICERSFVGGLSQIYRHAESYANMHIKKCEKSDVEANKSNENLNTQPDESFLTFDDFKKSFEIRFSALIAENSLSYGTAEKILRLFREAGERTDFPKLLKSVTIGSTKCANITTNVLGPVETERVVDNIQNTKFSISVDETSDRTNNKWMTFFVRYVDSETLDVRAQLVKLIEIDARDYSAEKLFNVF